MMKRLILSVCLLLTVCPCNFTQAAVFVPPSLSPGDTYHLAFVTEGRRNAIPDFISAYNTFVSDEAARNPGVTGTGDGVDWFAIASIVSNPRSIEVNARNNAIVGANTPVFLLNGTKISDGASDMWDGSLDAPLNIDQFGAIRDVTVWTGSQTNGFRDSIGSLESSVPNTGLSSQSDSRWIDDSFSSDGIIRSFYALSSQLTVPDIMQQSGTFTVNVDFDNPNGNEFGSPSIPYIGDAVVPGGSHQWNQVFTGSNAATPLLDSENNPTDIVVSLSRAGTRSTPMDFETGGGVETFGRDIPSNNAPNTVFDTHAGLFRDWAFSRESGNPDERVIGIQISGLEPGSYDFYAYAQEYEGDGAIGAPRIGVQNITYGKSLATNDVAFDDVSGMTQVVNNASSAVGLNNGGNYVKISAEISAGESFYIFGDYSIGTRASSFNGLQIVGRVVPEPSTIALMSFAAIAFLGNRRK